MELPPECVPYDPEAFMDANLAYKDHMPVDELSFAGFEAKRADITAAIVALRDSGDLTVDSLAATVNTAGPGPEHLAVIRAWDDAGTLRFDAYGPTGGCVEGSVTNTEVEMAIPWTYQRRRLCASGGALACAPSRSCWSPPGWQACSGS